ncbi:hypothetical protein HYY75_13290 [bacterium]|nr:hypothetical protein [bacterium]
MKKANAFTLIEICIGVVLGALILSGVFRLLTSSLRVSAKGSATLSNAQATAILMAQIVNDLHGVWEVSQMLPDQEANSIKLDFVEESEIGGVSSFSIIYDVLPSRLGVSRTRRITSSVATNPEIHTFCKGFQILDCKFRRIDVSGGGIGFFIKLKTGTPPNGTEEFEIKRFVFCRNLASNSTLLGW